MAEENLTLIKKLAKIRAISDAAQKDKKGYNYTYADITAILANVTAGMKKYGVSLIPSIVPGTSQISQNVIKNTKFDKTGKSFENITTEMLFSADMLFKWINDDNPDEIIEVPWFVVGSQSDPSQAMGGGLTYTNRYFLINYFQIAQTDTDVDAYRTKQKEAEKKEDVTIAEEIIKVFDVTVKDYLSSNPDKAEEVKKLISKYVKGGNYFLIKEPSLASKLLEEFKLKYLTEGVE